MTSIAWGPLTIDANLLERPILDVSTDDCSTQLFHPAPGVLVSRVAGHFVTPHARALAAASTQQGTGQGDLHYFSDWSLMRSYESDARKTMTDWGREQRTVLKTGTFLCGSRMVEMGVTVAGAAMAILGIEIRAVDRETFNRRLVGRCAEAA